MKSYEEVKEAVDKGKTVRCNDSKAYKVIKDNLSQYFVVCETNGHLVGIKAYNYCDFYVEGAEGSEMTGRKGVTRQGFGRLLKAGIPGIVIRQQGEDITIRLQYGNIYHGKVMDFVLDVNEGKNDNK